jgi:HSP20 family protein
MAALLTNGLANGWAAPWFNSFEEPEHTPVALLAADVIEDADGFEFDFDLPGVKADSIEVRVEDGMLLISAERPAPRRSDNVTVRRTERYYGSYHRAFRLPAQWASEPIMASYRDGVLHVRVAKPASAKPVRIKVEHN